MDPKPKSSRAWWLAGLGLMTAWAIFLVFFGPKGWDGNLPPARLEATEKGSRAEYRWTLKDLNGAPVGFDRFRGKAVFLNIWSTTCVPCLAEMPAISNLARNPRLKGIDFVCVATDEDPDDVRRFVHDHKPAAIILRADSPPPDVLLTEGIPSTFVIAADGRIVVKHEGPAQWDAPEVVDFLEALGESPGGTVTAASARSQSP